MSADGEPHTGTPLPEIQPHHIVPVLPEHAGQDHLVPLQCGIDAGRGNGFAAVPEPPDICFLVGLQLAQRTAGHFQKSDHAVRPDNAVILLPVDFFLQKQIAGKSDVQKNITIDGIDVPFKASMAVPRLYRLKFCRDIYQDFAALQKSVGEKTEKSSALDIDSLEVFENIAYIMAKHADAAIPASPDEWLEQFNTFSIYEILPQLIDLWGMNVETQVKSKKNIARLTDR